MSYQKRDLKRAVTRTARVFTFDMKHLPTEASVAEFREGLTHWGDFQELSYTDTTIKVTLVDKLNKLGRLTSDDEAIARLIDLAVKALVPVQGDTEEV